MSTLSKLISALVSPGALMVNFLSLWTVPAVSQPPGESPGSAGLQQQIATYSVVAAKAEPPTVAPVDAGRIWIHLGTLYEEAGQYTQSEMAYLHALRLLGIAPVSEADRARAMDDLGILYMMRGDTEQAERAELHALKIRKEQGLAADLPNSWYHLAALYLREHRPKQAQEYGQQAVDALAGEPHANPDDVIAAQFVLAVAQLRQSQYPEAIARMEKAMDIVRSTYQPQEFPSGFGSFLLGYAYWKSGDPEKADGLLKAGAAIVAKQLGSAHPVTQTVMTHYMQYLRNTHQIEEARAVDRQLKQTQSEAGFRQGPETLVVTSLF